MNPELIARVARIADEAEHGERFSNVAADEYAERYGAESKYPHLAGGLGAVISKAVADLRAAVAQAIADEGEDAR